MSARQRWAMMEAAVYAAHYVATAREVRSDSFAHLDAERNVAYWRDVTREQREREIRADEEVGP